MKNSSVVLDPEQRELLSRVKGIMMYRDGCMVAYGEAIRRLCRDYLKRNKLG